jgi:hypothetical protein
MTKRKLQPDQPPADELSSAPDRVCMRCGRGADSVLGPVLRDLWGFWQHAVCRHWTSVEADEWR